MISTLNINGFIARHADLNAGIILSILSLCSILFPRAIPFFYFAIALMAVIELFRTGKTKIALKSPSDFWLLLLSFAIWCVFASLWSAAPIQALGKVLFLCTTILAAWIISCWISTISSSMSEHLKLGLLIGVGIGAIFLVIETVSGQILSRTFLNVFEFARPDSAKHIKIVDNEVKSLPLDLLNRNIATLNILLWSTVFLSTHWLPEKWDLIISAVLITLVGLATFQSVHETSIIAFLVGGVLFILYTFVPRAGHRAVMTAWVAAIILILPLATMAHNANLHKAEWMPHSAQARIVLWSNTAHKFIANPFFGVGVYTTQIVENERSRRANKPRQHYYRNIATARHAHNIFLQTLYELGLVGGGLLLATGLALISRINSIEDNVKPQIAATFIVATIIAGLTWGLWQVWFIAMFGFGAAAALIAAHPK